MSRIEQNCECTVYVYVPPLSYQASNIRISVCRIVTHMCPVIL